MPAATPTAQAPAQHGLTEHSHGPGSPVPVQSRAERFASVDHSAFPPVTGLEAEWKLTPVRELGDLIDGGLDGSPLPYTATGSATVAWIDRDHALIGRAGIPEDRAAANAWSSFEKALHVRVDGLATASVERDGLGAAPRAAHTVIEATPNSEGLVVLGGRGAARLSENVEIVVGDGAKLTVVSLQEWDDDAVHLASHFARVGRDAQLKYIQVSLGGRIVRVNPSAHLVEPGGDVELLGAYFADASQHLEQRVYVDHVAPKTRSRVAYKGALQGAGARTVWVGDVLIGRDAAGTDSYESNRNLVLTEGTRADSIPNLEIETGQIEGAGHASATGRFDDEQLFYLQSRGIEEHEARRLVVIGFLGEIVQRIGVTELEQRLMAAIEAELAEVIAR